jgi:hypothetical protein
MIMILPYNLVAATLLLCWSSSLLQTSSAEGRKRGNPLAFGDGVEVTTKDGTTRTVSVEELSRMMKENENPDKPASPNEEQIETGTKKVSELETDNSHVAKFIDLGKWVFEFSYLSINRAEILPMNVTRTNYKYAGMRTVEMGGTADNSSPQSSATRTHPPIDLSSDRFEVKCI